MDASTETPQTPLTAGLAETLAPTAASATESTAPATNCATTPATDFWSSGRIAEVADTVTAKFGADENLLPRTLYMAVTDEHFLPIRVYPYLLLARRALAGMGLMHVASFAKPEGTEALPYTFNVCTIKGASRLVEIWTVLVDEKPIARFMLAPADTADADLVRADAGVNVYSVKTTTPEE